MSLEIDCDGDHGYNSNEIENGSEIYCGECYDELKEKVSELENELETANTELTNAQQTIADLEAKIEELEGS